MPVRHVCAIALLSPLLLSGCKSATGQQQNAAVAPPVPGADDVGKLPEMNHTYHGQVPFLDRPTPLPDGDWTVIATARTAYRNAPPIGGVVLLRRDGDVVTGLLRIEGNKVPRENTPFPISPVCTTTDAIWSDPRSAAPGGSQDCVMITANRPASWREASAPPALHSIADALDGYGITPPPVMLAAAFFVADAHYGLLEEIWLDPDPSGITPGRRKFRRQGWATVNLSRDPRKQAYVERLKSWSDGWRGVLTKVIAGGAGAVPPGVAATP